MNLRTVRCPVDAHALAWTKAEECEHWSRKCPRAKKAKKSNHKFKRGKPGYLVAITGIPPEGWPYDYDPPGWALFLSEKRVEGKWKHGDLWVPNPPGTILTCTACGLTGSS